MTRQLGKLNDDEKEEKEKEEKESKETDTKKKPKSKKPADEEPEEEKPKKEKKDEKPVEEFTPNVLVKCAPEDLDQIELIWTIALSSEDPEVTEKASNLLVMLNINLEDLT